jgi:hypothetical protein
MNGLEGEEVEEGTRHEDFPVGMRMRISTRRWGGGSLEAVSGWVVTPPDQAERCK